MSNPPTLQVGVIGYGYWGPNLVRNFMETEGCTVSHLCDLNHQRLEPARARYPSIQCTTEYEELIDCPEVDAIAIATPVSSHYELALRALQAGKHVLVEKPLAESAAKCSRLIEEAERRGLVLMVDHIFPYTGAVRKIKELIDDGKLGDLYYYDSVRVNLGLFQHDVNVIWDLAVHDLSIMDYLFAQKPTAVSATGMGHMEGQPENIAYLTCFFSNQMIAHIHVNWLAPVKIRRTLLGGSRTMVVYDDLEPTEKVKIYDKGVSLATDADSIHAMQVDYRTGDMWAPKLDLAEALHTLAKHFTRCCNGQEEPILGAESGLRVVEIIEAANKSLAQRGRPVHLGDAGENA